MTNRQQQNGFSLLEVLVAFAIFSITITVLFQIYHKGVLSARQAQDYTNAIITAQSRLATIGTEEFPSPGIYEGNNGKYRWLVRIADVVDQDDPAFRQPLVKHNVEVQVSWGHKDSLTLSTLKLFPAL